MGRIFIFFLFFLPALVLAQPRIAVSLDTIAITIGEDIQYQIEVQTDSTAQVIFPQGQTFLPFEIIDTTKVDIRHEALAWSVERGARSGRVAWQFIVDLAARTETSISNKIS